MDLDAITAATLRYQTSRYQQDQVRMISESLQELKFQMKEQAKAIQALKSNSGNHSHHGSRGRNRDTYPSSDKEDSHYRRLRREEDHGLRLEIPEFDGKSDPDTFIDWVKHIEKIFGYKDFDDRKRCKIAALKLTKRASLWFDNLQKQRVRKGKEKIKSWEKLKKKMHERFVPRDYTEDNYIKLTHLRQGNHSVHEYHQEFADLIMICGLQEGERRRMARFLTGLHFSIRDRVELQPYESMNDLYKLSLRVERQLEERGSEARVIAKGMNEAGNATQFASSSDLTVQGDFKESHDRANTTKAACPSKHVMPLADLRDFEMEQQQEEEVPESDSTPSLEEDEPEVIEAFLKGEEAEIQEEDLEIPEGLVEDNIDIQNKEILDKEIKVEVEEAGDFESSENRTELAVLESSHLDQCFDHKYFIPYRIEPIQDSLEREQNFQQYLCFELFQNRTGSYSKLEMNLHVLSRIQNHGASSSISTGSIKALKLREVHMHDDKLDSQCSLIYFQDLRTNLFKKGSMMREHGQGLR